MKIQSFFSQISLPIHRKSRLLWQKSLHGRKMPSIFFYCDKNIDNECCFESITLQVMNFRDLSFVPSCNWLRAHATKMPCKINSIKKTTFWCVIQVIYWDNIRHMASWKMLVIGYPEYIDMDGNLSSLWRHDCHLWIPSTKASDAELWCFK